MGIRISGMASGMDTEKIVKDLMKTQREPVNRLQRQKISTEWKRDAYRDINTLLADLQTTVNSIRYAASFNKKIATSENDAVVSAKVTGAPKSSSYVIQVNDLAKAEMPAALSVPVDSSISAGQKIPSAFEFSINGKNPNPTIIKVGDTDTDTIDKVIQKINGSGAGVVAQLIDNQLVVKSVAGDDKFSIKVTSGDGSLLGMGNQDTETNSSNRKAGNSANVTINGVTITVPGNTNTFKYDGIEFTLKQENKGNPLVVNTKADEDTIFNSIKAFVDKYNAAIDVINKKISEPKYKGYQPLLDEEKEPLGEKTAEKMDNMAKSGILLRDPILTNVLNEMRRSIMSPVSGSGVNKSFDTLTKIGIGGPPSGKYAYQENGKLYIDETKLRNAISNNGDDVIKLFTNYSSDPISTTKYNESGVAERLFNNLAKTIKDVTKQAGSSTSAFDDSYLSRQIAKNDEDINVWEDRLKQIEDRYYKQFSAMETAMSKAQSQGQWFAQMLGQR